MNVETLNLSSQLWADPRLVYTVAAAAVATLLFTIWLFRRRGKGGRPAGVICLLLSIALHAALIFLVPILSFSGGSSTADATTQQEAGVDAISFSTFDPDMQALDASGQDLAAVVTPLPVADMTDLLAEPARDSEQDNNQDAEQVDAPEDVAPAVATDVVPETLAATPAKTTTPEMKTTTPEMDDIDAALGDFLDDAFADASPPTPDAEPVMQTEPVSATVATRTGDVVHVTDGVDVGGATAPPSTVPGDIPDDFANRVGRAKYEALYRTGGDASTEAAVEAALKYLAANQRADGAWDPRSSGAGVERAPLGMTRGGAGSRAETALTGLSLLSLVGAGHTHQSGDYADNAYRGLVYLLQNQKADGSLAGRASVYAANYSHGMAALAMCETAAITKDASAIASGTRAIAFTKAMQHPTTGGWRYTAGDPGDLSQLGWQAMVMDAGARAGIAVDPGSVTGVQRFLRSVRSGAAGGLAGYRAGEAPSRTMTAEALATRLLIGEDVPPAEIAEAERYLLQQLPGVGQDNYYYWYYATLALHQLQDDAWTTWNAALKDRLLSTQSADGSWPADTVWGGYGGTVYTTAMATLCLEVYYRHAIRRDAVRLADQFNRDARRQ